MLLWRHIHHILQWSTDQSGWGERPPAHQHDVPAAPSQHQGALVVHGSEAKPAAWVHWAGCWAEGMSMVETFYIRPIGQGFAEHSVSLPRGSNLNLPVAL